MKKTYIKPISETIALPNLMQSLPVSGGSGSSTSGDSGGWSKQFWGSSVFEDTDEDEEDTDF